MMLNQSWFGSRPVEQIAHLGRGGFLFPAIAALSASGTTPAPVAGIAGGTGQENSGPPHESLPVGNLSLILALAIPLLIRSLSGGQFAARVSWPPESEVRTSGGL